MALGLAGQGHEAAHRLAKRIERGTIAVRAVLAEARYRHQDDAGVQCAQPLVVEAHGSHHAGAKVLQHDVGLRHQRGEDLLALGAPEIEADALLAAVVDGEVDALAAHHRRMPARLLAAGWLDLDDLGAEIRHEHAAARPRLEPRELENANAVETAGSHVVSSGSYLTTLRRPGSGLTIRHSASGGGVL